jgi:leucyl aminopeptidase
MVRVAFPALSLSTRPAAQSDGDVLVLGVAKGADGPVIVPAGAVPGLDVLLAPIGVTGAVDELTRLPGTDVTARSIALIGLGGETPDTNALRRAAGAATRQLRGVGRVVIGLSFDSDEDAVALLEGAALGAYSLDIYRSKPDPRSAAPSEIVLSGADGLPDSVLATARATAESVHLVRDLVNAPANLLTPEVLASRAAAEVEGLAAAGIPITARVLEPAALAAEGYGGILSVGQGSIHPPRLVIIEYRPAGATTHVALVGKGITFDTGGLSLKPASSMAGMKYDMTGSATVLGAALAIARLGIQTTVTTFMCIAENMAGSNAMRPNDVITVKGGTTVEVLNTDAEGRLVLADGLVAASALHPDAIIDVATLTGAARNAFGFRTTPVMGDADLSDRLVRVAGSIGEDLWRLPLGPEWRPQLKSDVADIANVKMGATAGGMFMAAAFLQDFVGPTSDEAGAPRIPWAHLDIAGAANNEGGAFGYTDKGTTGVTVRTLVALAADLAAGE